MYLTDTTPKDYTFTIEFDMREDMTDEEKLELYKKFARSIIGYTEKVHEQSFCHGIPTITFNAEKINEIFLD